MTDHPQRLLLRAHKDPLRVASAEATLRHDLIGGNTGNLVFSQSVRRLLSTADADITTGVFRYPPEQINAEFDHLVIPLANAFRHRYTDRLDRLSGLIEKLTIPVTVVGVGAQASLDGKVPGAKVVGPAVRRFVAAVLRRSPTIGVRGGFTESYLRGLGFAESEIDVIGCPSMFMYGPDLKITRKVEALRPDSPIALNISPYVSELGPISLDHAERYPNLIYQAQNRQSLELLLHGRYPMSERSKFRDSGVPVTLEHPLIRQNRVRFFLDPRTWFEHLAGYEFSFGTRIHGNIAALLAGTPALVLAHDSRTLELADYHRIPHRRIDGLPERPDAAELYAECDWESLNEGHAERWQTFTGFLDRHRLRHVYLPGESAERFDAAIAAADYPPPVETLMGVDPEQLYALKRSAGSTPPVLRVSADALELRLPWGRIVDRIRGVVRRRIGA
ncbi:polysaccharide pyruvyl transferase family protein [Microlunatus speluncae]|uniref:polysaccharide pyruvyl transferase family protein n=1 Tax=Microlunatus speluncae TaxID=2594267 RepID=UPI00126624C9|nr:polysaccharide pyruvyl transferase family protein [Microlunatus speluncae]